MAPRALWGEEPQGLEREVQGQHTLASLRPSRVKVSRLFTPLPPQVYHVCSWAALHTLGSLGCQLPSCPQHPLSWAVWGQSCTGCRLPSRKPLTFTTW